MFVNPYFEIILAALIWGSTGAIVKFLDLPPTTITFFRFAVPAMVMVIMLLLKDISCLKPSNKLMLLASALNAARMPFYFASFMLTTIANAIIILYTWPIFVTIFGAVFLKEKISRRNIWQLFLAFIGIVIIYSNKGLNFADKDFLGMSAMLLSAFIYSFTLIIYKKESKNHSKFEIIWYQNIIGAFVFFPFLFTNHPFPTSGQLVLLSGYACLIGVIGFSLFFSALKKIKASVAALFTYFEVISAILLGLILFKETISWHIVAGGLLIVGSTVLQKRERKTHIT